MKNYLERIYKGYSYWDRKQKILYIKKSYIIQLRDFIFPSWAEAERLADLYRNKYEIIKKTKKIIHIDSISKKEINIKTDGITYFEVIDSYINDCNFKVTLNKKIPNKYSLLNWGGEDGIFTNCVFVNDNKKQNESTRTIHVN